MRKARFDRLLAGTAVTLALALTSYGSSVFAETTTAAPKALAAATSTDPTATDTAGPAPESTKSAPEATKSVPDTVKSVPDTAKSVPAATECEQARAGSHRGDKHGAGRRCRQGDRALARRYRHRRQAARTAHRRKIRPHPRRQEGAQRGRDVLLRPRIRPAVDHRRRDERTRQGGRGFLVPRRCRRARPQRLPGARIQERRRDPKPWPKPRSGSPTPS